MGVISFTPTTWVDDSYPYITAAQLNRIETAIDELADGDSAAWSTWSPSYSNLTVGNGTATARYARVGNTVVAHYQLTLGSTSSVGTGPTISPPVSVTGIQLGQAEYRDASGLYYPGVVYEQSGDFKLGALNASATYTSITALSATIPFTWTTSDIIKFVAVCEAS